MRQCLLTRASGSKRRIRSRHAVERMGCIAVIEGAVWSWKGSASPKLHARVLAEANGWCTLMTNSAKLVNIIAGYGYEPVLADGPHASKMRSLAASSARASRR